MVEFKQIIYSARRGPMNRQIPFYYAFTNPGDPFFIGKKIVVDHLNMTGTEFFDNVTKLIQNPAAGLCPVR
jgi:hypothetical protein